MDINAIVDEIKLQITGGIVECDIEDDAIIKVVQSALRELQRYISSTSIMTVPYKRCIPLKKYKISTVTNVFRSESYDGADTTVTGSDMDPMQAALWQISSGSNSMYNFDNYAMNYASWNTMLQIRNTLSTDLDFYYDKSTEKLYINTSAGVPDTITIEYIPRFDSVEQINSDFWTDVLIKLALAKTKIVIGRVRKKFTQTNALWQLDTDILSEGLAEYEKITDELKQAANLILPLD